MNQDPNTIVMGNQSDVSHVFGTVTVKTLEGDTYLFPNMNVTKLKEVLPEHGRRPMNMPCLVMVNASMATITIPLQVIKCISVDTMVLWHD